MRVLVTGARGFVGRHLSAALRARGHEVIEADRGAEEDVLPVDVTDGLAVRAAFDLARPDAVAHLAAQAFVPASLADPGATFDVNARGTLHVLESARAVAADGVRPRVLIVSSADVYGAQPPGAFPLRETVAPLPRNPYAASKVAAEALALAYARSFGVDVVATRAFNHIGPGQDQRFAIASFAVQIARAAAGVDRVVRVGNLEASRDVLDVRDVCDAYALLLEGAGGAGEIYNVCSGKATTMHEILRRLIETAGVPVEVREEPERMRPADVPLSVGDASKLRDATGWAPRISLAAALRAVYEDARARISATSPQPQNGKDDMVTS
ncbi:MAG: GDP-4-dehydro-6-deoxy-D-mannose reductase [Candidatus Eremiobacteraeota bacterium]|nr:GDP-4-dehydro-6-deoxy-D-mannose reductase [Candidatus Eremiobacteraeota bacterium]